MNYLFGKADRHSSSSFYVQLFLVQPLVDSLPCFVPFSANRRIKELHEGNDSKRNYDCNQQNEIAECNKHGQPILNEEMRNWKQQKIAGESVLKDSACLLMPVSVTS